MTTWILMAVGEKQSYLAQTKVEDNNLVYRAVSKWLVRGGASKILKSFWEYVDQYDNELEEALLDQLLTQAETRPDDPQTTNVRTKDYSINMTVHAKNSGPTVKTFEVHFTLDVYFSSLKEKLCIDDKTVSITLLRSDGRVEKVTVDGPTKTPAHDLKRNRRVSKRSSKETPH